MNDVGSDVLGKLLSLCGCDLLDERMNLLTGFQIFEPLFDGTESFFVDNLRFLRVIAVLYAMTAEVEKVLPDFALLTAFDVSHDFIDEFLQSIERGLCGSVLLGLGRHG